MTLGQCSYEVARAQIRVCPDRVIVTGRADPGVGLVSMND